MVSKDQELVYKSEFNPEVSKQATRRVVDVGQSGCQMQ